MKRFKMKEGKVKMKYLQLTTYNYTNNNNHHNNVVETNTTVLNTYMLTKCHFK